MKRTLLSLLLTLTAGWALAQYPVVTVVDIQNVSQNDLTACNDTSLYFGDTVTVHGIAIHDGNLTEIASGSTEGGYRPAVNIVDTSNGGMMGAFRSVQVHGVYPNPNSGGSANLPVSSLNNLIAGTVIEVTGVISRFSGETQLNPINNAAVIPSTIGTAPQPMVVNMGDLNDNNRENQLPTGEQWEGSFVEIQNVTVVAVNPFSGGSRVSFDVADANGNVINVSDRFVAQKLPSFSTVNPASPSATGAFVAPPVGTVYNSIRGIIIHSENGCTGAGGRGYEINPFDASHYDIGVAPPNITNITRDPAQPTSSDVVSIEATATDFDGTVNSVSLWYTADDNAQPNAFTEVTMTLVGGSTDEYEADIPAQADGDLVRYYITATDDANNTTTAPFTPAAQTQANVLFYRVRDNGLTIRDIQENINPGGDVSPFVDQDVTFTGVVTASARSFDLGYVYVQDPNETEWAGINVIGDASLFTLYRGDEVTITGTVGESFGFTQVTATDVMYTGNSRILVDPVTLDPSDALKDWEKWESMLVQMVNPNGQVFISNPAVNNFADYAVSTDASNDLASSTFVQAGRQNGSNFSSLWVSLVSDPTWETTDGEMEVPVVETATANSMDTLRGIMYYGFGNYKVLPRNNADIIGLDVQLEAVPADTTLRPVGIRDFTRPEANIKVFPNPANEQVTIAHDLNNELVDVSLVDLTGRVVLQQFNNANFGNLYIGQLDAGIYLLNVADKNGNLLKSQKLIINH